MVERARSIEACWGYFTCDSFVDSWANWEGWLGIKCDNDMLLLLCTGASGKSMKLWLTAEWAGNETEWETDNKFWSFCAGILFAASNLLGPNSQHRRRAVACVVKSSSFVVCGNDQSEHRTGVVLARVLRQQVRLKLTAWSDRLIDVSGPSESTSYLFVIEDGRHCTVGGRAVTKTPFPRTTIANPPPSRTYLHVYGSARESSGATKRNCR